MTTRTLGQATTYAGGTMRYAYTYVLNTLADWELGYIVAELNSGRYFKRPGERLPVKTVGATKDPITTTGGMTIVPDATVAEITTETSAVLLLAGADTWKDPKDEPILAKAEELLDAGANVAAICGATSALANLGLFDSRPHTSNAREYLALMCPSYKGQQFYRDARAVADGNLITAGSAGALLWARYILARLDVFAEETLAAWYQYFATGEPRYFFEMMQTLPRQNAPGT
jgi:putative intracellular protease/amidase